MHYAIQTETITTPRPTAVVRRRAARADLSRIVPECCGLVWNELRAHQIKGAGRHVSLYLDG